LNPAEDSFHDRMSWRVRFAPSVGSLVTFLNPKDPHCFGVRSWWRTNLPELQVINPGCTFSIQELSFGEPYMFVNYSPLDQRIVRLAGATEEEMDDIMESIVTYGSNHAIIERPRTDDGGDPLNQEIINSFGYTESFNSKLEVKPAGDVGHSTSEGVDDPGQKPKRFPRNASTKFSP
jgi:hypothetical protein